MRPQSEWLGPTKIFIRYQLGQVLHCTDVFPVKDLAKQVKDLKAAGVTNLTIYYTNNPPPDHIA